ncbi:MAG: GAF domain-containing sensor histidine kinase, partial [candidate division Zixibacteria bacterium]|nr:GAF domain-containing sensor histidine kinase [candidate division Zixibacteria bacterium]NIR67357.1 GAF domain-containing sensor histidine kinase [candidate division Zixibacteria bacterium]NIS16234.1 GAF domain-containing sensor histidine kinase [candidate division Zixibacteria bacterium]NIS48733.1 GAF domain-containing sensor histidine kinase [candidate division Zixibacteria bacterium]NIT52626.1 GAF domain-containing sensor histidine kinase [candidate division Zixibacteria bacterium]
SAAITDSAESVSCRIKNLKIPLDRDHQILNQVVLQKNPMIIGSGACGCDSDCRICSTLGVEQFAAVPMIAGKNVLGLITADNFITGRTIKHRDLSQLQVFANQAAIAIERTRLYQSLSDYLKRLEKANINLRNAQEELLKIERVTLWSELTSDIAHELRNPVSIIGGFAALIIKSNDLPDNIREQAGIIYDECTRLESALNTVLDFSKSFAQEKAEFDIYEVVCEISEIFLTKEVNRQIRIHKPVNAGELFAEGRVDQIKFAFYTIMSMISEKVDPSCCINIRFYSADNNVKAVFEMESSTFSETDYLSEIANPSAGRIALQMSMAFEAIKYNGGNLGIEPGAEGRARICVEWPNARR